MNRTSKLVLLGAFLALVAAGAAGANAQGTAQPGQAPSTVDPPAQQNGQPQPPKTTGAMDNAVTGIATSPDDVKRQSEGQPTAADQAKGATATAPKPGMTNNAARHGGRGARQRSGASAEDPVAASECGQPAQHRLADLCLHIPTSVGLYRYNHVADLERIALRGRS